MFSVCDSFGGEINNKQQSISLKLSSMKALRENICTRDPLTSYVFSCWVSNPLLHLQKEIEGLLLIYRSRQKECVMPSNVNGILERSILASAHELGHAVFTTYQKSSCAAFKNGSLMIDQSKKMKQTSLRQE